MEAFHIHFLWLKIVCELWNVFRVWLCSIKKFSTSKLTTMTKIMVTAMIQCRLLGRDDTRDLVVRTKNKSMHFKTNWSNNDLPQHTAFGTGGDERQYSCKTVFSFLSNSMTNYIRWPILLFILSVCKNKAVLDQLTIEQSPVCLSNFPTFALPIKTKKTTICSAKRRNMALIHSASLSLSCFLSLSDFETKSRVSMISQILSQSANSKQINK